MSTVIEKTKHIILYLIQECEKGEQGMTLTKLYKLLYFIDFGSYALHGQSVTELSYLKFKYGPVPLGIKDLIDSLQEEELISTRFISDDYDGHNIFKLREGHKVEEPNFTPEEKKVLEKTLQTFKDSYAIVTSRETHYHYAWISTENGKVIPYEKAEHCDFKWLNLPKEKDKEYFDEIEETRSKLRKSERINSIMDKLQKA